MATCSIDDCERVHYAQGWCERHYQRYRRWGDPLAGGPAAMSRQGECSVEGCGRPILARGWCGNHYYRAQRNNGDPHGARTLSRAPGWRRGTAAPKKICTVPGCDAKALTRGWCGRHYQRWQDYGDPEAPLRRARAGESVKRWTNHDGYVLIRLRGRSVMEHRHVMEEKLGRKLLPGETVHHMNGIRTDNRPGNLELWVSTRSGQRVADLIAFVVERYRADVESALSV